MRPLLRSSIEVLRTGRDRFVLMDSRTGHRFECGEQERYIVGLLDGTRSLEDIEQACGQQFGKALQRSHVRDFLEQLHEHELLANGDSEAEPGEPQTLPAAGAAPTPLSDEDPKAALNYRFDLLAVLFGWLLHPFWALPAALLGLMGTYVLVRHASSYVQELTLFFRSRLSVGLMALSILQTIVFMNLPRELALGIACRKYGGRVYEFGIRYLWYILPHFYCETGDSVVMMGRVGRWTLLTAGVWTQMAIGAIAAIGWHLTEPNTLPHLFWMLLVPPCVLGLALHAVVFVPLDGYRMLSMAVGAPRLRERAVDEVKAWLSLRASPEPMTDRERFWLRAYGLGYYLWRLLVYLFVFVFIGTWLVRRFEGPGGLVLAILFVWWHWTYIGNLFMVKNTVRWSVRGGGRWWLRWPLRLIVLAAIVACGFIPYNHEISGDCRLIPREQAGVRAQVNGEVTKVHVKEGDWVKVGDPIVTLAARDELADLGITRGELDKARANLALLKAGSRDEDKKNAEQEVELRTVELGFWEFELKRMESLATADAASQVESQKIRSQRDSAMQQLLIAKTNKEKTFNGPRKEEIDAAAAEVARLEAKLAHHQEMVSLADIKAPIDGRVTTAAIEQRIGQYVERGDLIAVIQDTANLVGEITTDEVASVEIRQGMPVNIRLWALNGQPLGGQVLSWSPTTMHSQDRDLDRYRSDRERLVEERASWDQDERYARVYVGLAPTKEVLTSGMTGYARIVVGEDLLWRAVARPVLRFFEVDVWSWLP